MKDSKKAQLRRGAIALRQQFVQHPGSIFSHVLGVAEISAVVAAHVHDYRERIYSPLEARLCMR